jgi:succinyl-diaminopimelate desuccinylase
MADANFDAVELSAALIRCQSVTPVDDGAIDVMIAALEPLGFTCTDMTFDEGGVPVRNLFARAGGAPPHFCFAGHTDVVPVGDADAWTVDPFGAEVRDGFLWGRGATDMKAAIGCFAAAAAILLGERGVLATSGGMPGGSISLLITGDEEGPGVDGTKKVLKWMADNGHTPDAAIVGEPTNPQVMGQMMKIGRRGSLVGRLTVHGIQGHAAYPQLADNPVPRLVEMLSALTSATLDPGTDAFQPSNLEITTIDVGNPAVNVIPAQAKAIFNIRFNDRHTSDDLSKWLREQCDAVGGKYDLDIHVSGEAFLSPPGPFADLVSGAVTQVLGVTPERSTSGGISDARFVKDYCPVAEFGLITETAHKVDERASLEDMANLTAIYAAIMRGFLPGDA